MDTTETRPIAGPVRRVRTQTARSNPRRKKSRGAGLEGAAMSAAEALHDRGRLAGADDADGAS
jgi:hypothetical protein